jgi:hypothetical protein
MKRRENAFWLVLGTIYVVGLIALIPAHGEICKESAKTGEEACTSYSLLPFVFIKIGQALDALGVAITALATIAIAWFTWSLRRSTDKLWEAGERQIELARETSAAQSRDMQASIAAANRSAETAERALTELEAPVITLLILEPGITRSYGADEHIFQTLTFCVANDGRTPARLIEIVDGFSLVPRIKGLPEPMNLRRAIRNPMPWGVIAPPNGQSQPFTQNVFAFVLGKMRDNQFLLKSEDIFYYGFVRYADVFKNVFRVGFCYRFDISSEKWLLLGDEDYNYHQKERDAFKAAGPEPPQASAIDPRPKYLRNVFTPHWEERVLKGPNGGEN